MALGTINTDNSLNSNYRFAPESKMGHVVGRLWCPARLGEGNYRSILSLGHCSSNAGEEGPTYLTDSTEILLSPET